MTRRKTLSRHAVIFLMFCITIVPLIAACGGSAASTDDLKGTLVVWAVPGNAAALKTNDATADYVKYYVNEFQKEHPGVTVKVEDHGWDEQLRQNLETSILGGTAPDVTTGEVFFPSLAALGQLSSLDDTISDVKSKLMPTYTASMYNGHVYSLSAFTGLFGFERNCIVLQKAGIDCDKTPATWQDLLQDSQTITQKGGGNYFGMTIQGPAGFSVGGAFRIAVLLAQANAPLCKDNCQVPWFNNPNAVQVYQFLRDLNKTTPPGLTFNADESAVYTQMFKNKTAYQIAGSWYVSWSATNGCPPTVCKFSALPLPPNGKQATILVGNAQYAVLKASKHQTLAKEFVKFMASNEGVQDRVYAATGNMPDYIPSLDKLNTTADPATKQFIQTFKTSQLSGLPGWVHNPQTVWTDYNNMLTKVFTTNTPIQQLLNDAQAQAESDAQG